MKKVLVLWADDRSANLGVRALAQGAGALVREAFGENVDVHFQDFAANSDGFVFSRSIIQRDFLRSRGPVKARLEEYDAIIDTGAGDSFTDIYGWKRFAVMSYVQQTAARLGVPVVLTPQTIGPFNGTLTRMLARANLRTAPAMMVRDSRSAEVARSLGREPDAVSTDMVFALPCPEPSEQRRDVIFNVSGLLWNGSAHVDAQAYRDAVRQMITVLCSEGRTVTLLAHVLDGDSLDNDVMALREVRAEFPDLEYLVPADLLDVRAALASARLVIGARMHACLNALSVGTPAIPWAYSRKFAPLLDDLGWTTTVDLRTQEAVEATVRLSRELETGPSGRVEETISLAKQRLESAKDVLQGIQL